MMKHFILVILLVAFISTLVYATPAGLGNNYANNPPQNRTCLNCHAGNPMNSPPGLFQLVGLPAGGYTPGQTYPLQLQLGRTGSARWGFQLTVLHGTDNAVQGGQLINTTNNTMLWTGTGSAPDFLSQTNAGNFQGTVDGPVAWSFNWTAPVTGFGDVRFFSSGAACNNTNGTGGDFVYTLAVTLPESTVNVPPNPFTLLTPANGSTVSTTSALFTWERATDPNPGDTVRYSMYLSTDSTFHIADSVFTDTLTSYQWSNLANGTTYFWGVAAYDQNGGSRWSTQVFRFTVSTAPPIIPPHLLFPENSAMGFLHGETNFVWSAASGGEPGNQFSYSIWLYAGVETISYTTNTDTTFTVRMDTIPINIRHMRSITWTVSARTTVPQGVINAPEVFQLNINTNALNDPQLTAGFALSEAYPNPFNSSTRFTLTLPNAMSVRGDLFNLNGQMVTSFDWGVCNRGAQTLSIDNRHLGSGTYFLQVHAGTVTMQRRVVYLR